jgi:hypothetical protein
MAQSNFQDVVQLNNDTLSFLGNELIIGSTAGSKSLVFAQDPAQASALFVVASNPAAQVTQILQAANGTIGLISAISAGAGVFNNGELVFSNGGGVSFGIAGSTITASVAAQSVGPGGLAAGTQTATSGTVVFSNSNLISFGMSNSSVITATAGYVASISAGTTNATGNQVVFANGNGVSFGVNGATVTASIAAGAAAVNALGLSTGGNTAGNTGTTNGTIVFVGAGIITASQVTAAGSQATITFSATQSIAPGGIAAGTQTGTSGTVVFSNSNNISFGMNNSSVVTASATFAQSTAPGAIAAGTQTGTSGTILFSNSNGVTFGMSNSSIVTASIAAQSTAPGAIAAGTQTATSGTIVFSNSNGVTFGMSNSSVITASFNGAQSTAPGAIAAGTQTATSGTVVFSNSNGISFGMSNSSQVTASFIGHSITAFSQWAEWNTNWTVSAASFSMQKVSMPMVLSATRAQLLMALSGNTNSSGAMTVSIGIYTMSGSTASLASSGSAQVSWTSGSLTTASSQYGGVSGTRYITVPANFSMTPGDYMIGFNFSTNNNGTWRAFGRNGANVVGSYEGDTDYWIDGTSVSSVAGGLLASFVKTDTGYARTGLGAQRQPGFILIGTN